MLIILLKKQAYGTFIEDYAQSVIVRAIKRLLDDRKTNFKAMFQKRRTKEGGTWRFFIQL